MPPPPFKFEAILPIDAKRWFNEKDCPACLALIAEIIGWGGCEVVESKETDDESEVTVKTLLSPDAKSAKDEYFDIFTYPKPLPKNPPYIYKVKGVVPQFGEKCDISTTVTIESMGPNQCKQTVEGYIEVKVFGIGTVAQKIIRGNLEKFYKTLPQIAEKWEIVRLNVADLPGGEGQLVAGEPDQELIQAIPGEIKAALQTTVSGVGPKSEGIRKLNSVLAVSRKRVQSIRATSALPRADTMYYSASEGDDIDIGPVHIQHANPKAAAEWKEFWGEVGVAKAEPFTSLQRVTTFGQAVGLLPADTEAGAEEGDKVKPKGGFCCC